MMRFLYSRDKHNHNPQRVWTQHTVMIAAIGWVQKVLLCVYGVNTHDDEDLSVFVTCQRKFM